MQAPREDETNGLVQHLARTRQGRMLTSHLANVAAKNAGANFDAASTKCFTMRRVLLTALRDPEVKAPFSLPRDIPKAMLVANICGDYMLLYNTDLTFLGQIMTVLAAHGTKRHVQKGFEDIKQFVEQSQDRCAILFYCQPALDEPSAAFWELRTISIAEDKALDGARVFSRGMLTVQPGSPTPAAVDLGVSRAEVSAMQNHLVAVAVEGAGEPTTETSGPADSNITTVLRQTIAALQADRKKMLAELESYKSQIKEFSVQAKREALSEVDNQIKSAQVQKALAAASETNFRQQQDGLVAKIASLEREVAERKRLFNLLELTTGQELSKFKTQRSLYDTEKRQLSKRAERGEKEAREAEKRKDAELENLRIEKDAKIRSLEREKTELVQKQRMAQEIHDRVVNCMSAQDTEIVHFKSSIADKDKVNLAQLKVIDELRTTIRSNATLHDTKVTSLSSENAELRRRLQTANDQSRVSLQESADKAASEVAALEVKVKELQALQSQVQERSPEAGVTSTEAQTTMTAVSTTTTGTDCYIDTAMLSKACQTEPEKGPPEPTTAAEASRLTFAALEKLVALAQLPPSDYVPQSGVHPPPRRFQMTQKKSQ